MSGLYAVYDKISKEFSPPNECKNKEVAIRQFKDLISKLPAHTSGDYEMFQLGEYDREKGIIVAFEEPVKIQEEV